MGDRPKTGNDALIIAPGEVALIIQAIDWDAADGWDGEIKTNMVMNSDGDVPLEVMGHMVEVLTMMTAFLSVSDDHPEIYDIVEMRRNELLGLDIVGGVQDNKESVTKVGNVYTIDKWTKTKGDC
jgi:hypothetical protein|tara:strand:+ start:124 stop:498 length:375 start_codon:yes stop_codon:yes gene_type:complete